MTAEELLMLVREGRDSLESFYALEGARDEVRHEHLPALAAAYPILDWPRRRALVFLVQDQADPATRSMMEDFFVHSPDEGDYEEERVIALCHLEGGPDAFERYLEDPDEVERKRALWRAKRI